MWTAWGYEIDGTEIPALLGGGAFDAATGGKYAGDIRAASAVSAASAAIRNACGWHIAPVLRCTARLTASGRLCRLPANQVAAVLSVADGGAALSEGEYEWDRNGVLRRACFRQFSQALGGVEAVYDAGIDPAAAADLADAVRYIAEGVLGMPVGVRSETAGGVSISYAASAQAVASAMADQMRAQLSPYRLVSARAA